MNPYTDNSMNLSIAKIFRNSNFKSVLKSKDCKYIDIKIRKYRDDFGLSQDTLRKEALQSFYTYMTSNYRCEYVYKNIITNKILIERHNLDTSNLLNEFRVGSSLADLVIINCKSIVYEIKTELDSPDRLESQITDYQKAFRRIVIVVHNSQVGKYLDIVKNTQIGVLSLTDSLDLEEVKKPSDNPEHLDISAMFKCLRKKEYSSILIKKFGNTPNVPNMYYFKKCLELAKSIDRIEFHDLMNKELKNRGIKIKKTLKSKLIPQYLNHICVAIDPSQTEVNRLNTFLNDKIS